MGNPLVLAEHGVTKVVPDAAVIERQARHLLEVRFTNEELEKLLPGVRELPARRGWSSAPCQSSACTTAWRRAKKLSPEARTAIARKAAAARWKGQDSK